MTQQRVWSEGDELQPSRKPLSVWTVVIGLPLLIGVPIGIMVPAVREAREAARRMQCANVVKQMGLALHNYYSVEGCLPPAHLADASGKPMHSWRTLILPYIDYANLYQAYDFNQPWDSPKNSKLTHSVFAWRSPFHCPSARDDPLDTNYVMIVGPDTVSDGTSSTVFRDVEDGTSMTILFIEVVDSGIHWAEPRDLSLTDLQFGINGKPGVSAGSHHRMRGVHVSMMDGSVKFLDEGLTARVLTQLANKSDGKEATEEIREALGW